MIKLKNMIEINNLTAEHIDEKLLKKIAEKVLKGEGKKASVSVAFINPKKMRELNREYRKKNKPTDVLSFSDGEKDFLGEIIICPKEVRENSKEFKSDFKKELFSCLIHGILHLLGYDHEKNEKRAEEMEKRQEHYLSQIKF
ncbi:MAG: rRNA maturation RNase YbeY [Candidatus Nealsonbacteria bacterium CG_4_8_14_3_um_filter_39_7]|nr:MAG: rRNA maturation RNase YbeY [Candidatus Nealsonbacteria bacterium CG_4_8_14_3_um_filter_39_7]